MTARGPYQVIRHGVRRYQRLLQMRVLLGASRSARLPARLEDPISVFGLFSSSSGLGEAARCLADGLSALGHDVRRIDVTSILDPDAPGRGCDSSDQFDQDPGTGAIFIHLNPVEAVEVLMRMRVKNLTRRLRVGVWIYELSQAPGYWRAYTSLFDAIWTPSESSAQSLLHVGAKAAVVPYRHQIEPFELTAIAPREKAPFNVVVFADARSSLARKNVSGAIDAFQAAFPQDASVTLTLKLSNLPSESEIGSLTDERINVVPTLLNPQERIAMIAGADVLLSLHRAEGYGLSLIEAMLCGTPLVMTNERTTRPLQVKGSVWPVASHPVPVFDPQNIYQGGFWAEADINRAASHLRSLFEEWQNGALHTQRPARQKRARAHFSSSNRLEPMKAALQSLEISAPSLSPARRPTARLSEGLS